MGVSIPTSQWLPFTFTFTLTLAAITVFYMLGKKWRTFKSKVLHMETSLKASLDKCAAERQGRIRAQQDLRKALLEQKADNSLPASYPMIPIGTVQSCFSTRNGTPRQPLLVPLARACLMFDPTRVPPASLEGLEEYSHIWIIYVFHLNTDLDKLWLEPSRSKIKAKIEAVQGNMILLSGVDLVEGTPVLDIKPYLSYCDSIRESVVPEWVKDDGLIAVASVTFSDGFYSALAHCWELMGKSSLYSSPDEMKKLIEQVLSWDIRSSSQRHRPHKSRNFEPPDTSLNAEDSEGDEAFNPVSENCDPPISIIYHLVLEGLDISYMIDCKGNVLVDNVAPVSCVSRSNQNRCNYSIWKDKLG
ncbi:hypothetical protein RDABS01_034364 [Bienertia sinuspersici]